MKSKDDIRAEARAIDKIVGQNLLIYRLLKGLSQEGLGKELGLSFQQVQKYEKGANRISAGKLFQLAKLLNVSIPAFFENPPIANPDRQSIQLAITFESLKPETRSLFLKLLKELPHRK